MWVLIIWFMTQGSPVMHAKDISVLGHFDTLQDCEKEKHEYDYMESNKKIRLMCLKIEKEVK